MLKTIIALAIPLLGTTAIAKADVDGVQVDEDAELVGALYRQHQEIGDPRDLHAAVAGKKAKVYLDALARMDAQRRFHAQHEPQLETWRQRYAPGARTPLDVQRGMNQALEAAGVKDAAAPDQLASILAMRERMPAVGPELAGKCVDTLETFTDDRVIASLHPMYQMKAIEDARQLLAICPRFVPGDARMAAKMERIAPRVEEVLARFREIERKLMEERTWDRGVGKLSSGSPVALGKAARAWLERSPDWGASRERPMKVLAVVVTGDWFVAERNLAGQPTKWGLPVHAALIKPDTAADAAQVIELSMITTGNQKAGTFAGPWVGNTWMIYRARVR